MHFWPLRAALASFNMDLKQRVVVTGIGVVSSIGIGKHNFINSILEGRSGIKRISHFDASSYPTQVAGEIRDFDPTDFMSHKITRRMDRSSQMILASAIMAVKDAKIESGLDKSRVGVFTGTAVGGQAWAFREYEVFKEKGIRRINPFTAISTFPNASSAQISTWFEFKGPSDTFSSGCVSSTIALGYALDSLRYGRLEVALVGGTEAPLDPGIFGAYCAARVMTSEMVDPSRVPRPFDLRRDGIVLSEGAAVLVCETLAHAVARNARIYAEIAGWCHNSDSYSMMMLNPDGVQVEAVMRGALLDANISAEEIEYVQAHAAGTVFDDPIEAAAICRVFGARIDSIPVVSMKSLLGHTQGACGAIETAAAALAIYKQVVPRSINCDDLDPRCDLHVNRETVLHRPIKSLLVNTFGFGGKNSSIILRSILEGPSELVRT
jgi:3-oxoacyl-[acyl-carrier-protein] synthase II